MRRDFEPGHGAAAVEAVGARQVRQLVACPELLQADSTLGGRRRRVIWLRLHILVIPRQSAPVEPPPRAALPIREDLFLQRAHYAHHAISSAVAHARARARAHTDTKERKM